MHLVHASGFVRPRSPKISKYRQLALQYITMAFSRNPAWVQQEIGLGDYAELGANPLFHRW